MAWELYSDSGRGTSKVEVKGILLDPDDLTRKCVAEMFGERTGSSPVAPRSFQKKLGNILRAIRGI